MSTLVHGQKTAVSPHACLTQTWWALTCIPSAQERRNPNSKHLRSSSGRRKERNLLPRQEVAPGNKVRRKVRSSPSSQGQWAMTQRMSSSKLPFTSLGGGEGLGSTWRLYCCHVSCWVSEPTFFLSNSMADFPTVVLSVFSYMEKVGAKLLGICCVPGAASIKILR